MCTHACVYSSTHSCVCRQLCTPVCVHISIQRYTAVYIPLITKFSITAGGLNLYNATSNKQRRPPHQSPRIAHAPPTALTQSGVLDTSLSHAVAAKAHTRQGCDRGRRSVDAEVSPIESFFLLTTFSPRPIAQLLRWISPWCRCSSRLAR